jgi:hypothetical protein
LGSFSSLEFDLKALPTKSLFPRFCACLLALLVIPALAACASQTFTTVDNNGFVGEFNSLALNSSGFPVISYRDYTSRNLKLAVCADAACVNKTIITVDSAGRVGQFTSLALNGSGFPVISYYDHTNGHLKLAVCADPVCSNKFKWPLEWS